MLHADADELHAGLDELRLSPTTYGIVELIVRRPAENEREILAEARLDVHEGLVGDTWPVRGSRQTDEGSAHPGMQ